MKACIKCYIRKAPKHFRVKVYQGKSIRSGICMKCSKEIDYARNIARREKKRQAAQLNRAWHRPDQNDWHLPRKPWPWPPGTKVFEDVTLKRAA